MKSKFLFFITMCAFIPPTSAADAARPSSNASPAWKQLAPIPDPVGFGGMFAGVLGGKLVTGGGSQFRERPIWLKGEKSYSDRIYVLDEPNGAWREIASKLPEKSGHFACASTAEAIYLVGGITAAGFRSTCYALRAKGDEVVAESLADFPKMLGYAAAAVAGGRLFVAGGQGNAVDKSAFAEMWSLDLSRPGMAWKREPDFPGPGVFVAGMAADAGAVYLFGGMSFNSEGKPVPPKAAYRYDIARSAWEKLPDMPEPRVGPATPCPQLPDGKFFLIGGYAEIFPGAPREHPGFSSQTLVFDPVNRRWQNGPVLPRAAAGDRDLPTDRGPFPMIAAPGVVWRNLAVVIGGEVRAATRTQTVMAWPMDVPASAKK